MTDIPGNQPSSIDPSQPIALPPTPPFALVVEPPRKKGTSTFKIVLIVVGIILGLGILGAGVVSYGVYKLAKSSNITTSTQPVTESDLGVAPYPGAESKTNMHMTIAGKNMVTAAFLTSDSKDQAIAYYQGKLGPDARLINNSRGESLMLDKGAGESVLVTVTPSAGGSKTQIVVLHATPASQKGASN